MEEYISVVIPTYNREKTIKRSIDSVLKQTHKFLEVIIVDDHSTDNTEKIVKKITDERIRYVKLEKNEGANYARNKGIELAKYDLIAFQDSDDEWLEDKLKIQLKYLKQNNLDFVASSYNQYINDMFNSVIPIKKVEANYLEKILISNFVGTVTILIKKEILIKEKFNINLPRLQDYELSIRLFSRYKGKFINIPMVNAYVQEDSISKDLEKYDIAINKILRIHLSLFKKNKKILSIKYLELYKLGILLDKNREKYLYLSLRSNKNIKNIIFLLIKILYFFKIYKKYIKLKSIK